MLIKSIELTNFRIFAGIQLIEFSTDDKENVTVIMGDNGSGKTTLAQAFSWCLYGVTTFKRNDDLLSFPVRDKLAIGQAVTVKVALTLIHGGREYRIIRSQEYRKDSPKELHADGAVLSVSYRESDGQDEFVEKESDKKDIINEIIPSSVSSYFFFDGERVERMGNEIQSGRGKEFKVAVDNLLGLSAISEAIRHLKGGSAMVIGSYSKDYNANSDEEYQKAEREIQAAETRIAELDTAIIEIENNREQTTESRERYRTELERAKESREWAEERSSKKKLIEMADGKRQREMDALTKRFGGEAWRFFAAPLLASAASAIDNSPIEIKDAPSGVNADTIEDIIERKTCLCGTHVAFNSKEYNALRTWLDIVPPEHMGAALKTFKRDCSLINDRESSTLLDDITLHITNIRGIDNDVIDAEGRVKELDELLAGAKDMSKTEQLYQTASKRLVELDGEKDKKTLAKGMAEANLRDATARRNNLTTNDATNKRVRRDRDYAEWIYDELNSEHERKEAETRQDLESEINSIFREFFNGSLELELDDKYNVTVRNKDAISRAYDVETSEGQTVSVIFAFIAGVIRLATDAKRQDDDMLLTEAYPLVMDAPMSKLDKKRIEAVCEVVPRIAEQTIIMIKDTDGELARDFLSDRMGIEYKVISVEPERYSKIERADA